MLFYLIVIVFAMLLQINNDFEAFKRIKQAILYSDVAFMGKNKKSVLRKLWNLEIVLVSLLKP